MSDGPTYGNPKLPLESRPRSEIPSYAAPGERTGERAEAGVPTGGVPGFCGECEQYDESLQVAPAGDTAVCSHCADRDSFLPAYSDLRTYECDCRRQELAVIGSLEERLGLCAGCVGAGKLAPFYELDASRDSAEFVARSPGDHADLPPGASEGEGARVTRHGERASASVPIAARRQRAATARPTGSGPPKAGADPEARASSPNPQGEGNDSRAQPSFYPRMPSGGFAPDDALLVEEGVAYILGFDDERYPADGIASCRTCGQRLYTDLDRERHTCRIADE
jgi:hypothetical protein